MNSNMDVKTTPSKSLAVDNNREYIMLNGKELLMYRLVSTAPHDGLIQGVCSVLDAVIKDEQNGHNTDNCGILIVYCLR